MRRVIYASFVWVLTLLPYCAAFGQSPVINGSLNGTGAYVPNGTCSTCVPLPVDNTGLPATVTQVIIPASGTTGAVVATMPAVASKTNYLCFFEVDSFATAATTGSLAITGLLGGTLTYLQFVPASTAGPNSMVRSFVPCLQASAANTAIVVTSAAPGAGGVSQVNVVGYVK